MGFAEWLIWLFALLLRDFCLFDVRNTTFGGEKLLERIFYFCCLIDLIDDLFGLHLLALRSEDFAIALEGYGFDGAFGAFALCLFVALAFEELVDDACAVGEKLRKRFGDYERVGIAVELSEFSEFEEPEEVHEFG